MVFLNVSQPVIWSANRPGIATTMWGRLASLRDSSNWSEPPVTMHTLSFNGCPRILNWSAIFINKIMFSHKLPSKGITTFNVSMVILKMSALKNAVSLAVNHGKIGLRSNGKSVST
ncbi:hypothetical protein HW555_000475 [Spodoptera exigua]|uniref:Uncharacterized protein n=1 Tax=Spodoptera exigua TaxID=7107 RepID=A0A835GR74_SPOEX|nr:hypothetical protein HW555_000475 [Spodoptera exigua]